VSNDTRRVAGRKDPRRQVAGHYSAGADDAAIADLDRRAIKEDAVAIDEAAGAEADRVPIV
jgi:hypothetical protein